VTSSETSCEFLSEWGRCAQRQHRDGWCSYHFNALNLEDFRHDQAYHRKIVAGLLEPSHDVLTTVEVDALFRGRCRNDGRRTDLYTVL
jgi:hypothetical protein